VLFIFLLVAVIGLISIIFGFPGNFIILADSVFYGWYGDFKSISFQVLIVLILLAVLGEVIEFLLGIIGSKRHKSSNSAIVGSIVGGIIGVILGVPFLFGVGALLGAFLGAFVGAFLVELIKTKHVNQSMQSGWGALIGRVGGTISKGIIGVAMVVIVLVSVVRN